MSLDLADLGISLAAASTVGSSTSLVSREIYNVQVVSIIIGSNILDMEKKT